MKYFLVAGEPSGDVLGGKLIDAIKEQDPNAEFYGIGGTVMVNAGLNSLFPMSELTVIGIWEAMMRLPQLLKIRKAIVFEIEKLQPDAVITIDFPDFNFALAKKIRANRNIKTKLIHYVAPTVWAWRPGRAKDVAKYLDAMICILPFEPPFFKKHKLPSIFVGHPITQDDPSSGVGEEFRRTHQVPDDVRLLGLFFGSRQSELHNNAKIIKETAIYIKEQLDDVHLVVPTLESLEYEILQILNDVNIITYVESDYSKKWDAMAACDAAIAVSGTVGLELAYAGVPHVIVYKAHPVTYLMVRLLVKVKYAHLANIILNKPVVPEFLQMRCKSELISAEVLKLLENKAEAQNIVKDLDEVRKALGSDQDERPSAKAARYIMSIINRNSQKKAVKSSKEAA